MDYGGLPTESNSIWQAGNEINKSSKEKWQTFAGPGF